MLFAVGASIALCAWTGSLAHAQEGVRLTVEETGGIRRTFFPVRATIEIPAGRRTAEDQVLLLEGNVVTPAQGRVLRSWEDGTVRTLEIDFNVSIGPFESRTFELSYNAQPSELLETGRGLSVAETADGIQVGRVRFGRRADPLFLSVDYRGELVTDGANGLVVVDDAGVRHEPSEFDWSTVEVRKRGPLTVHIRYEGTLELDRGAPLEAFLDVEMPNSKSWVRIAVTVIDPDRRLREVSFESPLHLGDYPWTWDFGTPNSTYGAFREASASAVLIQAVDPEGRGSWEILVGDPGNMRPYEASVPGSSEIVRGWAHVQNGTQAVAFAIEGVGEAPGTFTSRLCADGHMSFAFAPAELSQEHSLTIYQHYVSVPVPIGAATSPASILSPLRVQVEPLP